MANCIPRLQTRASTVKKTYSNLDPIYNWVPTPADNIQPQWLTVEEEHISRLLLAADIPCRENTFEFSEQSAGAWKLVLLALYVELDKEIHIGDTVRICSLSGLLIELIKTVGVCLCAIPSFDAVCAGFAKIQGRSFFVILRDCIHWRSRSHQIDREGGSARGCCGE